MLYMGIYIEIQGKTFRKLSKVTRLGQSIKVTEKHIWAVSRETEKCPRFLRHFPLFYYKIKTTKKGRAFR